MSSKQHDNLRSQPKLLLLRVEAGCLALVLWGNLRTEACKFVHAFCAFFTESHEVHCQSKSRRINQINREKSLQWNRFWALGRASSQFSGSLRSTTARWNCAASSGSFSWYSCNSNPDIQKTIPFSLISLKVTLKNHSKKFKVRNGRDQGWKVNRSGRLPHLLPGCLLLSTCLCVLAEGVIHLLWHLTG